MAEWLGTGLQNLVQRFESASDLKETQQNALRDTFQGIFLCSFSFGDQNGARLNISECPLAYPCNIPLWIQWSPPGDISRAEKTLSLI